MLLKVGGRVKEPGGVARRRGESQRNLMADTFAHCSLEHGPIHVRPQKTGV